MFSSKFPLEIPETVLLHCIWYSYVSHTLFSVLFQANFFWLFLSKKFPWIQLQENLLSTTVMDTKQMWSTYIPFYKNTDMNSTNELGEWTYENYLHSKLCYHLLSFRVFAKIAWRFLTLRFIFFHIWLFLLIIDIG